MHTLTKRQYAVFAFIAGFIVDKGYSPSFDEIGNGMDLSSLATVHKHIKTLTTKGYLTHDYNRSRSLKLTDEAERWHRKRTAAREQGQLSPPTCPKCRQPSASIYYMSPTGHEGHCNNTACEYVGDWREFFTGKD